MPRYAPFVYDVWRSPTVLDIVSKIAGVELVPQMDFEIAHINISTQDDNDEDVSRALQENAHREADEGVSGCPWEDDHPIVDWHTDSYPFVCVTMLSDCTNMIGGETILRTGDGGTMKVRGPAMVRMTQDDFLGVTDAARAMPSFCKVGISSIRHSEHWVVRNELHRSHPFDQSQHLSKMTRYLQRCGRSQTWPNSTRSMQNTDSRCLKSAFERS